MAQRVLAVSLILNIVLMTVISGVILHRPEPPEPVLLSNPVLVQTDWPTIEQLFASHPEQIHSAGQSHSRGVQVRLHCGIALTATEPNLDDILDLARRSRNKRILLATE